MHAKTGPRYPVLSLKFGPFFCLLLPAGCVGRHFSCFSYVDGIICDKLFCKGMALNMREILKENRFDFLSEKDKTLMVAFHDAMTGLGYDFNGEIGEGYCWGKYMVIYTKSGVKSKKVYARMYLKEEGVALRLFLSNIDRHREFLEKTPAHIKEVFTGDEGKCEHCHNEKDSLCRFRKSYTLGGRYIEKCNGKTFTFPNPGVGKLSDYINLFSEFYPSKRQDK